jgi:phosphatidylinositol alpha-1,6-mannosyltransferase
MVDRRRERSDSRVMLITRNLPPLLGGMERLNLHIVQALADAHDVSVVGPAGCSAHLPSQVEAREVPAKPLWQFIARGASAGMAMARRRRPRWVIAGSGLAAPLAWAAARLGGARSAVYLHGLDIVVRNRAYRLLWLPFIRRCDLAIANSRNTRELAIQAGVPSARIVVINPSADPPGIVRDTAVAEFRNKHGLGDRPLLVSVGRMTPRKGLAEFARKAFPQIVARYPAACLVVVGNEAPDALAGGVAGAARAGFEQAISELGLAANVCNVGTCSDAMLSAVYRAASVHVFPVIPVPGDVEGFGMVALEAAAHGLPTVAFDVGGIADAVGEGESGYLVESGDYAAFASRVVELLGAAGNIPTADSARAFASTRTRAGFAAALKSCLGLSQ